MKVVLAMAISPNGLAAMYLVIENLTNLDQLADKDFKVYASPLNLQIDGSPESSRGSNLDFTIK